MRYSANTELRLEREDVKESDKWADSEMDDDRMQFLEREHSDIFSIELMY